jgi:flavin reductase (DIM6/NTAB) family NADH-FMN oxidoreductase RutF
MSADHDTKNNSSNIDTNARRNALGSFATGITVVTAVGTGGQSVGMTVNSFNSVSLNPPLVLWSIDRNSNCFNDFINANAYAVHVLSQDQQNISNTFASSGADKFADLSCTTGLSGVPILPKYSACFECVTEQQYDGGDHVILVGRVMKFTDSGSLPLIFYRGNYKKL